MPSHSDLPRFSIVVPTLDEAATLRWTLEPLQSLRGPHEIVVVDGGSRDGTPDIAASLADRVLVAPRGRAQQMNAGAQAAAGEVLLFLHADTRMPTDAIRVVGDGLAASGRAWGRFDVRIEGRHPLLGMVACLMNLRSRVSGIATGDQAIFVRRAAFHAVGGFPPVPLMEDVAISRALKRVSRPWCSRLRVVTSGRRWETRGVLRTIVLMWWLRLRYALGTPADQLARLYD